MTSIITFNNFFNYSERNNIFNGCTRNTPWNFTTYAGHRRDLALGFFASSKLWEYLITHRIIWNKPNRKVYDYYYCSFNRCNAISQYTDVTHALYNNVEVLLLSLFRNVNVLFYRDRLRLYVKRRDSMTAINFGWIWRVQTDKIHITPPCRCWRYSSTPSVRENLHANGLQRETRRSVGARDLYPVTRENNLIYWFINNTTAREKGSLNHRRPSDSDQLSTPRRRV